MPRARALTTLVVAGAVSALAAGPALGGELIGECGTELCVATETGKITPLTTDGGDTGPYVSPSMSADGARLLYVKGGRPFTSGRRGAAPSELLDTDEAREIEVSPDGTSIVFRSFGTTFSGGRLVFESVLHVAGTAGSGRLSSQSRVHVAGWLGNSLIATGRRDGAPDAVCRYGVIATDFVPPCAPPFALVAGDATRTLDSPVGSPDGRYVAAEAAIQAPNGTATLPRAIVLFDAATGAPLRELTAGADDTDPAFSPDGTRVAFTRDGGTWVVPVGGGTPRLLVAGLVNATWGGDGRGAPVPAAARATLKGRAVTLTVRCRVQAGCAAATWRILRGRKLVASLKVPELKNGGKRGVRATVSAADATRVRAAGTKGLKLKLATGTGRARPLTLAATPAR